MLPATLRAEGCEHFRALSTCNSVSWRAVGQPVLLPLPRFSTLVQSFLDDIVRLLGSSRTMPRGKDQAAQRRFTICDRLSRRRIAAKSPRRRPTACDFSRGGDMLHSAYMECFLRSRERAVGAVSGGDLPYLAPADPT